MKQKSTAFIQIISVVMCVTLLVSGFNVNASDVEKYNLGENFKKIIFARSSDNILSYSMYIDSLKDKTRPINEIILTADSANLYDGASRSKGKFGKNVIAFEELSKADWVFDVLQEGLYRLEISYYFDDSNDLKNPTVQIEVNDKVPFSEASTIELKRNWKDVDNGRDINGNDLAVSQQPYINLIKEDVVDPKGFSGTLCFWLKQGKNKVSLKVDNAQIYIEQLRFYNDKIPKYDEYARENLGNSASSDNIIIQAEKSLYKNDSALTPATDRSGPDTIPNDPVKLRLNIISGNSFSKPGQKIVWEFDVKKAGEYKIGFRYRQNALQGLFVNRELRIDDQLPYEELSQIRFDYTNDWKYNKLNQSVYLDEGKHTISLAIVGTEIGPIASRIENCVYVLNYLYRKIIIITGTSPDSNRDYFLDKEIPELIPLLKECSAELDNIYDTAVSLTKLKGGQFSVLQQVSFQLKSFLKRPEYIAYRLDSFKSNISAVSSLLMTLQQQNLDLDYITLEGTDSGEIKVSSGWISRLVFHVKSFIGSFFNDYVSIASKNIESKEKIKVWYSGGREQAEIIKRMIDSDFTIKNNISVDLKLVQIPIAQAVLARQAPDVVLNVSRNQPVNLAARGVLVNFSEFSDIDVVTSWFNKDACLPYQYNGGIYGIPVTLDFHMLFYRKDILDELNISVPNTWDEFYSIIPKLQKANLEIGIAYSASGSQGVNDTGLIPTFLIQRGGEFYNKDQSRIVLDSPEMMSTFKDITDLYTKYDFSLQYDFYNRFRTGEMPIGIQNYTMHNLLSVSAPEIDGLWGMTTIPGTVQSDGTINRSETSTGTAAVIINTTKKKDASWKLVKWWCSPEVQAAFGNQVEMLLGKSARYNPASLKAMEMLPWSKEEFNALKIQKEQLVEIPEVVGGYFSARGIDNAFKNVLYQNKNYRESLLEQEVIINNELKRKRIEFGLE